MPCRTSDATIMTVPEAATAASCGQQRGLALLDILVLAGGPGAERDVSLASGRAVHEALSQRGHRTMLRDISPCDLSALDSP
ncbi:MAG: hypothetical protein ACE5HE_07700, partial [Phycisphaerae bacterium]